VVHFFFLYFFVTAAASSFFFLWQARTSWSTSVWNQIAAMRAHEKALLSRPLSAAAAVQKKEKKQARHSTAVIRENA